jgi:DNA-directed RNA polymerase I, II, and III subunit RPABC2
MGNIVTSGDVSAQEKAAKSLNTVKGVKDKKISTENRSTTPYMTKYERARVLGTRALQIRYVGHRSEDRFHIGSYKMCIMPERD